MREVIRAEALPLDIHIVQDGQEAIDFITRTESDVDAPCPHFLILDLNLPKRDGFEVLRRLRQSQKCAAVPVLVMTSSNSPRDLSEASALGARYFRKPPSYQEFLKLGSAIRQLLEENGLV